MTANNITNYSMETLAEKITCTRYNSVGDNVPQIHHLAMETAMTASEASAHEAQILEEQRRQYWAVAISTIEEIKNRASSRDALAEKAMIAYLLKYGERGYSVVAEFAYKMADAMIVEREKRSANS